MNIIKLCWTDPFMNLGELSVMIVYRIDLNPNPFTILEEWAYNLKSEF